MEKASFSSASVTRSDGERQRTLSLKKGQIFEGKVIKLFPNQVAALRLGTMNVTARLEAALTAGERYFFQVKQNEGIPRLQVLDAGDLTMKNTRGSGTETSQLLKALGVQENRLTSSVLRLLQEKQVPFTKAMLTEGANVLKQAGALHREGVTTLAFMSEKQLPITLQTFHAVTQAQSEEPLSGQIRQLLSQLQNEVPEKQGSVRELQQLQDKLKEVMKRFQIDGTSGASAADRMARLLPLASGSNIPDSVQEGAESLLKRGGLLPQGFRTTKWLLGFKHALMSPANREAVQQLWPGVLGQSQTLPSMEPEALFQQLTGRLQQSTGTIQMNQLQTLFDLFQQAAGQSKVSSGAPNISQVMETMQGVTEGMPLQRSERQALTVLFQGSLANETQGTGPSALAAQFANILSGIGLSDEAAFAKSLSNPSQESVAQQESLKQTLQQLLPQLPSSIRDSAEGLLNRLTGQQLLAQEQHGLLQQLVVQIPLLLGEHQADLTMQWEGKKQSDGTLHPDHCRILFYLELERLGETVADVQIQNRYVTITIFNDHEKPAFLVELLQPFLKERLDQQQYQLHSLNWKTITESRTNFKNSYHSYSGFEGVDVRI